MFRHNFFEKFYQSPASLSLSLSLLKKESGIRKIYMKKKRAGLRRNEGKMFRVKQHKFMDEQFYLFFREATCSCCFSTCIHISVQSRTSASRRTCRSHVMHVYMQRQAAWVIDATKILHWPQFFHHLSALSLHFFQSSVSDICPRKTSIGGLSSISWMLEYEWIPMESR